MKKEFDDDFSVLECPLNENTRRFGCFRILLNKQNYKFSKTAVLIYSWICLGLYSEILGPSLPELRRRTNSNYEEISRTLTARAFGYLIGSTVGGLLHDRFYDKRSSILSVTLLVASISIAVVPWCQHISTLGVTLFIGGLSHGFHTTGGNPSLAELWKEKSSGPFNLMHAGFGGGASIAPLLVKWFSVQNMTQEINHQGNTTLYKLIDNGFIPLIEYSYLIIAGACCFCGLLFGFFGYLGNPLVQSSAELGHNRPSQISRQNVLVILKQYLNYTKVLQLGVILLLYFFVVGNERVFGKFLYSYAIDSHLKMDPHKAFILNTIYWLCFCGARLVTSLLLRRYTVKNMFFSQIVCTLMTALMLNIFSDNLIIYILFSSIYGLAKSPLFPTGLGVINEFIEVSGIITAVVNIGSAIGAMSMQYLTGSLIEYRGQLCFLYVVLGSACGIFVMGTVTLYMNRKYKEMNPSQLLDGSA